MAGVGCPLSTSQSGQDRTFPQAVGEGRGTKDITREDWRSVEWKPKLLFFFFLHKFAIQTVTSQ